ncbi:MAG: V-type ATP synthase subunit F [Clostridia bacterium]|nr:V-type ATP synthase subunit F [Clostridia bacterium]
MKMFCVSRSTDVAMGLKLSGIETLVVNGFKTEEIKEKIFELYDSKDIGILGITEDIYDEMKNEIEELAFRQDLPLIVKIPNSKRIQR